MRSCLLIVATFFGSALAANGLWADVESGPKVGEQVPPLTVFAVVGEVNGEKVDFVTRREQKPTLYLFVPAEKFSRPTARLIRTLDEKLTDTTASGAIVAVWVTGNVDESKAYLPRAQMSLMLDETTWCVYEGDANGPNNWGLNSDADITVVAVVNGKVQQTWGFVSANETLADEVLKVLK
ncbi:MAG: hypothetical protein KDA58_16530 [Planctomycetaceae bacterium]|nr:hypothetical protein [Planctomycetaceae bacterium]